MHLSILLTDLRVGGTERQFLLLARGLAEQGHRVRLLTSFPGGDLEEELDRTLNRAGPLLERRSLLSARPRRRGLALPRAARTLRSELRRDPPDVLYTTDYPTNLLGGVVAPRLSIPLVWGVRNEGPGMGAKLALLRGLGRRFRGRVALCIANSEVGLRGHERLGYLPPRTTVIPNGVDTGFFSPPSDGADRALRAELGVSPQDLLVGLVARLDRLKEHPTFVATARRLVRERGDLHFLCAAPTLEGLDPELAAAADEPELRGRLHFRAVADRVVPVYRALDVAVSLDRAESQVASLARFEQRASHADVIFTEEKRSRKVEVVVFVDGAPEVAGRGEGEDFRKALDQGVDRVRRQLREQRERRRDHSAPPLSEGLAGE